MANLEDNVGKITLVATGDGRIIVGTLKGFDQTINLVLEDAHERIFSHTQGVEQVPLGLYLIRGDNVACDSEQNLYNPLFTDTLRC
ncbi:hypothetical protein ACHWQZ_G004618 [Mnemiopsis leidyi]